MRARMVVALGLLSACGFNGATLTDAAGGPTIDASGPDSGDPPADASGCLGAAWSADFSSDPTAGGTFALRGGNTPFPSDQLASGVWHARAGGSPLDTNPRFDFASPTFVHVRLRSTAETTFGQHGAVFWINVGYRAGDDTFAPLILDVGQHTGVQTVLVLSKDLAGNEYIAATLPTVPVGEFADVAIEIDPATLTATANGVGMLLTRQPSGPAQHDAWATLLAYTTSADFDLLTVQVCQ